MFYKQYMKKDQLGVFDFIQSWLRSDIKKNV